MQSNECGIETNRVSDRSCDILSIQRKVLNNNSLTIHNKSAEESRKRWDKLTYGEGHLWQMFSQHCTVGEMSFPLKFDYSDLCLCMRVCVEDHATYVCVGQRITCRHQLAPIL